jgi:peptidoglycan/xylan/chitin deacetylase (PgdA/CDA1 family)
MHRFFIRTPWIVQKLFPWYVWRHKTAQREVFLTFDDGPHPVITPWVIEQLKLYDAKATFFCIGSNVDRYPKIFQQIIAEGHAVGNHTYHHLNGWKTKDVAYLDDIQKAAATIKTHLFRPPYGRIRKSQARQVPTAMRLHDAKVIMWDVLSADFDQGISPQVCLNNVIQNVRPGSIVVFHDSEKAFKNLEHTLPLTLKYLQEKRYKCSRLD